MSDFVYAPEKYAHEQVLDELKKVEKMFVHNDSFSGIILIREINNALNFFQKVKLSKKHRVKVADALQSFHDLAKSEGLHEDYLVKFRTLISSMRDYKK